MTSGYQQMRQVLWTSLKMTFFAISMGITIISGFATEMFVARVMGAIVLAMAILVPEGTAAPLRKPLAVPEWDIRIVGDGKEYGHDYQPRIELDAGTGDYKLSWTNHAGKRITTTWEPSIKVFVTVCATVVRRDGGGGFEYRYLLHNGKESKQKVRRFDVESLTPVSKGTRPQPTVPHEEWWFGLVLGDIGQKYVWQWTSISKDVNERTGIPIGGKEDRFSFFSQGLPSVMVCHAAGGWPVLRTPEEVPEVIGAVLYPHRGPYEDCVSGVTVGPGEIPKADTPKAQDLLAKMLEYVQACVEQGWIDAPGLADEFKGLLSTARQAVEQGNMAQASETLLKVIETVEQHTSPKEDKGLTSEAVALLKINAEFLRERIK